MPEFKDMLKYFRMRENLSQSELAEKLGVSASTISMYEVGKREPDFETEEAIADFNYAKLRLVEAHNTYDLICNHYKLDKYNGFDDNFALDFFDAITNLKKKER